MSGYNVKSIMFNNYWGSGWGWGSGSGWFWCWGSGWGWVFKKIILGRIQLLFNFSELF